MLKSIITDQIDNDLEKTLPIIKEEGYEYVELHNVFGKTIEACSDEEVNQIRSLLQKYDMKVSNLASTVFFYVRYIQMIKFHYLIRNFIQLKEM